MIRRDIRPAEAAEQRLGLAQRRRGSVPVAEQQANLRTRAEREEIQRLLMTGGVVEVEGLQRFHEPALLEQHEGRHRVLVRRGKVESTNSASVEARLRGTTSPR